MATKHSDLLDALATSERNSGIHDTEGKLLQALVHKLGASKVLEVGMANGISAAFITTALQELGGPDKRMLISIDPFQKTQWESQGLKLLKRLGTQGHHKLIQQKSYTALPALLAKHEGTFDMVFIDGWHTFDYTLLDAFYGILLLRRGGVLVVDDALHAGVRACLAYMDSNYSGSGGMLKRIPSTRTMAAYMKIEDSDPRPWHFHKDPRR